MFIKPAPDPERPGSHLVVRFPAPSYAILPPEGRDVPETQFWLRRLLHGDVVLVNVPTATPAAQ